jgi:hypothetical protein
MILVGEETLKLSPSCAPALKSLVRQLPPPACSKPLFGYCRYARPALADPANARAMLNAIRRGQHRGPLGVSQEHESGHLITLLDRWNPSPLVSADQVASPTPGHWSLASALSALPVSEATNPAAMASVSAAVIRRRRVSL